MLIFCSPMKFFVPFIIIHHWASFYQQQKSVADIWFQIFFSLIFMFVLHKWAASLENFVFWGRWLAENENCVLAQRQWLFSEFILIIFVLMFFMSSWWYFIDWVNFDCGLQVLKYLKNNLVTILRSYCAIQFLEQIDIPTPCPWQEEGV